MKKNEMILELQKIGIETEGLKVPELNSLMVENGLLIKTKPIEREIETSEPEIKTSEPGHEIETSEPEIETNDLDELEEKIKKAETIGVNKGAKKAPLIEKTAKKRGKKESNPDSFRLEGYVLLLMVDTVFPFVLSFVHNLFEKRFKVEIHELSLNEKDFAKLEPLADQAADYLSVNINPVTGFLIVAGFMYGSNILTIRSIKSSEFDNKQPIKINRRVKK